MYKFNKNYKIVLVGFGRFGALMYKILSNYNLDVVVVSARRLEGLNQQSLIEAVKDADLIVPCVPISGFEQKMEEISKALVEVKNINAVVWDICSVKIHPAEVMQLLLPAANGIVASHPVWGPDSTKNGTEFLGLKFIYKVLRNNGNPVIQEFLDMWSELGLNMIELNPDEHDRQAAYTHAFAFLIGRIGIRLGVKDNAAATKGLQGILYNQQAVQNDSGQLFHDMFRYNPYTREMLERFINTTTEIKQELFVNNTQWQT